MHSISFKLFLCLSVCVKRGYMPFDSVFMVDWVVAGKCTLCTSSDIFILTRGSQIKGCSPISQNKQFLNNFLTIYVNKYCLMHTVHK